MTGGSQRARWTVRGERRLDADAHVQVDVADIELPDGTTFTQYVFRIRRCVMTVVLDEAGDHILLLWRHRFIVDRWVWELPGGYVTEGEDAVAAAAREVEEETGWRPRGLVHVLSFQPVIGTADSPQDLYVARGADHVGEPLADETEEVRWVPLDQTPHMIARGEIVGAATIIGVQHALLLRAGLLPPG